MLLPYLLIVVAFGADRLSKWWAADYLTGKGAVTFGPVFSFQITYNRGIALGIGQGIGTFVGWLSLAVVAGLFIYLSRVPRSMSLLRIGLGLLIGGALGNLVDRVTAGQVLDFIQTPVRPGIFNVADVMIYLGIFLGLAGAIFQRQSPEAGDPIGEMEEGREPSGR